MKLAAIDIGSNSIHVVIVRAVKGQHIEIIDREKETTRLGSGALIEHKLSKDAIDRAVMALRRFKQMAVANKVDRIITTATAAVRESNNADKFIERVQKEVGLEVHLLPGVEEARLIALAVSEVTDFNGRRGLIIDIGGGSTELIVTDGGEPRLLMSLRLGAVRLTEKFITTDPISDKERENLITTIRSDITRVVGEIKDVGFDFVIGTSGTILNITDSILQIESGEGGDELDFQAFNRTVTLKQISRFNRNLARLNLKKRSLVPGLEPKRADIVIAGGLLLETLLAELGGDDITSCDWALREGVVLDHLRKQALASPKASRAAAIRDDQALLYPPDEDFTGFDVRTRSVLSVARRFDYDAAHSHHIARLATSIFDDTRKLHGMGESEKKMLQYAALLHDIGYRIAHNNHHRHSLYLIKNSEMPGFTANEIAVLAAVVRYHRGTMPRKPKNKRERRDHDDYYALKREHRSAVMKLASILQIADGLDRSYSQKVKSVSCTVGNKNVAFAVECDTDCDLELWSAERKAKWFSDIFHRNAKFTAVAPSANREVTALASVG